MFKRKVRRRPNVRRRVAYPPLRLNPDGYCTSFKFDGDKFLKGQKSLSKQEVSQSVYALLRKLQSAKKGESPSTAAQALLASIESGLATSAGANASNDYKKALLLIACFWGFIGDKYGEVGGGSSQYYLQAGHLLQYVIGGNPIPEENVAAWKANWENIVRLDAAMPSDWTIKADRDNTYSMPSGAADMWSETQTPSATAKKKATGAEVKAPNWINKERIRNPFRAIKRDRFLKKHQPIPTSTVTYKIR